MSDRPYLINTQLVTFSGELMHVGVTPGLAVEVNNVFQAMIPPDEAVCLAGLMRAVNKPCLPFDVRREIEELRFDTAGMGVQSNNIFEGKDTTVIDSVIASLVARETLLSDNLFRLEAPSHELTLLLNNVVDFAHSYEVVESYFESYTERSHLSSDVLASFETEYREREDVKRRQSAQE